MVNMILASGETVVTGGNMANITTGITSVLGFAGTALDTIVGNPVLCFIFCLSLVIPIVAIVKRFTHI